MEKFSGLTNLVSCNLDVFMRTIHDTEFPNSFEATEKLLIEQSEQYDLLKSEIMAAAQHGENLLEEMKRKDDVVKENPERLGNLSAIERLVISCIMVNV